ncbi:MAG TPA: DEAD/DEAH box helicase, partial [Jatrophihabitantaceae bacterium]|nr:DEAD/DEAH box helicase [Jatrophihabitantaceae bacterium]
MAEAGSERARELLARLLAGTRSGESPLTHTRELDGQSATFADWPAWTPEPLRARFGSRSIDRPWSHQAAAASLAHDGESVVLATGTGSGKSLAYQLPALTALLAGERATVLYLAPTKALAGDQLAALSSLLLPGVRAATYDGDTPAGERDWVRAHANWILTNPDMLHRGMLPQHRRWSSFFRRLRYVIIDECHAYRGLFGSHVAHVIRRLRRVCHSYGAEPVFVLASATVADPAASATGLVGLPVTAVTASGAPRGTTLFALWEPPLTSLRGENGAPVRRSAGAEAARLLADLVIEGARTLAFVRSRRGAELTALGAQRALGEAGAGELSGRVAAYRAGYLAEQRRELEAALGDGRLLGVASTNALELGLDVAGLDAVLLAGYPGTLASLWQQAGRAGRAGSAALVVFVARDDPLDTYLVHHPESIFGRPVEASVFDPSNPYVLRPQLCCAAAEQPLTRADFDLFGPSTPATIEQLVAAGLLRQRPTGWFWTDRSRPGADIRGSGGEPIAIVDADGSLLGTVDAGSADSSVHTGAVYLHRGESYLVDELDLAARAALVHAASPDWSTSARDITDIEIIESCSATAAGPVTVHFGTVRVTNRVVSYLRRRLSTGEFLDETPLELPERELRTRSVWYTVEQSALDGIGLEQAGVGGAAHAAEHAAIGLLPLFATCDRWDIGGVSTALHADTGKPTIFVYDGYPGGAGFAERGHQAITAWLSATRETIAACGCPAGCPSCVQSPKCGNGN